MVCMCIHKNRQFHKYSYKLQIRISAFEKHDILFQLKGLAEKLCPLKDPGNGATNDEQPTSVSWSKAITSRTQNGHRDVTLKANPIVFQVNEQQVTCKSQNGSINSSAKNF
jgi:hypothetical protein